MSFCTILHAAFVSLWIVSGSAYHCSVDRNIKIADYHASVNQHIPEPLTIASLLHVVTTCLLACAYPTLNPKPPACLLVHTRSAADTHIWNPCQLPSSLKMCAQIRLRQLLLTCRQCAYQLHCCKQEAFTYYTLALTPFSRRDGIVVGCHSTISG